MKKRKVYFIVWRDACFAESQLDEDDLPNISILHTVGFLIRKNSDCVTVAREESSNQGLRGVITIPRENIVSMKRLR